MAYEYMTHQIFHGLVRTESNRDFEGPAQAEHDVWKKDALDALNVLGSQGWEAVGFARAADSGHNRYYKSSG